MSRRRRTGTTGGTGSASTARALVAVVVVLLLVTAGCSSLSGPGDEAGGGAGGGDTPTLTPVPVVTGEGTAAAATPTPETLVAGLGPDRVRNPFTLATRHRDALYGRSYRRVGTERIEGPNGTLWNETTRVRVSANRSRLLFERDVESAPTYPVDVYRKNLSIYYDGNASYLRGTVDGELSYAKVSGGSASVLSDVPGRDRLLVLYDEFRFDAETVPSGYRLTSRYLYDDTVLNAPPLVEDATNATMTAWLTESGRVRFYRLAYDGTVDGRPVRFVRTVRFAGVGTTTVPVPEWYTEAVNATDG